MLTTMKKRLYLADVTMPRNDIAMQIGIESDDTLLT